MLSHSPRRRVAAPFFAALLLSAVASARAEAQQGTQETAYGACAFLAKSDAAAGQATGKERTTLFVSVYEVMPSPFSDDTNRFWEFVKRQYGISQQQITMNVTCLQNDNGTPGWATSLEDVIAQVSPGGRAPDQVVRTRFRYFNLQGPPTLPRSSGSARSGGGGGSSGGASSPSGAGSPASGSSSSSSSPTAEAVMQSITAAQQRQADREQEAAAIGQAAGQIIGGFLQARREAQQEKAAREAAQAAAEQEQRAAAARARAGLYAAAPSGVFTRTGVRVTRASLSLEPTSTSRNERGLLPPGDSLFGTDHDLWGPYFVLDVPAGAVGRSVQVWCGVFDGAGSMVKEIYDGLTPRAAGKMERTLIASLTPRGGWREGRYEVDCTDGATNVVRLSVTFVHESAQHAADRARQTAAEQALMAAASDSARAAGLRAQDAYAAGDYAKAREEYERSADAGYPLAAYMVGYLHLQGQGVPKDYAIAAQWMRKAADAGYGTAAMGLGLLYEGGYGVPASRDEALRWYRRAVELGSVDARAELERLEAGGSAAAASVPAYRQLVAQGIERARAEDWRAAADLFDRALADNPYDHDALFNGALARVQLGSFDAALPLARRVLALDPDQPATLELLAVAFWRMQRALPDTPANAGARRALADSARRYVREADSVQVEVGFRDWTVTPTGASLTATLHNRTANARTVTFAVRFLDRTGAVLSSTRATYRIEAGQEVAASASSDKPGVVAFRYEPLAPSP